MRHIALIGLAIALTAVLSGCGWSDRASLEGGLSAAEGGWPPSHGQPALPPGHPPITRGQGALPPGHPPIPEGSVCPGGGLARDPAAERSRDSSDVISI